MPNARKMGGGDRFHTVKRSVHFIRNVATGRTLLQKKPTEKDRDCSVAFEGKTQNNFPTCLFLSPKSTEDYKASECLGHSAFM